MTTTEKQVLELSTVPDSTELPPEAASAAQAGNEAEPVVDSASGPPIRRAAYAVWQRSVAAGQPLTGGQLGEQFNRPEEWGWARIAEVYEARGPREFARTVWQASAAAGKPLTDRAVADSARTVWQASAAAGRPLTDRALADLFHKSESWGRDRIAEARQAGQPSSTPESRALLPSGPPTDTQIDDYAAQIVDRHDVDVDELHVVEPLDDEVPPAPSNVADAETASLSAIEDNAALVEREQHARSVWLLTVDGGKPWTGAMLAERYGQPEEWGWARIAEVYEARGPREFARSVWQASAAVGKPLTGRELAEVFRRSERWGRDRIAEARQAPHNGATETATTRRHRTGKPASGTPSPAASDTAERQPTPHAIDDSGTPDAGAVDQAPHDTPTRLDEPTAETPAATVTAQPVPLPGGARLVAWAGFLFGTAISVAANVLYAWLPTLAGKAGPPGLAPQVGAAVWPIALVISVEVLSRVAWRPGWAWQLARYGGAGVVALGAAVISYGHLSGVLTHWGYGTTGAAVGPLVVDGLMTISGFALLAMSHSGTNGGKEAGR